MGTLCTTAMRSMLDVHVMWVRFERIPEEDDEVNPSLDDSRSHPLVAAKRATQKARDLLTELGTQERPVVPVAWSSCFESVSRLNLVQAN
jgi:hypothetical protein